MPQGQKKRRAGMPGPIAGCGRVRQWAPYRSRPWREAVQTRELFLSLRLRPSGLTLGESGAPVWLYFRKRRQGLGSRLRNAAVWTGRAKIYLSEFGWWRPAVFGCAFAGYIHRVDAGLSFPAFCLLVTATARPRR